MKKDARSSLPAQPRLISKRFQCFFAENRTDPPPLHRRTHQTIENSQILKRRWTKMESSASVSPMEAYIVRIVFFYRKSAGSCTLPATPLHQTICQTGPTVCTL
ncbi:hypothetical protein CEXT_104761 [Caerostris extrusa]|uniref:Uncharacterized protein n=1 Tax=Caerostris extrusa TaxID=172846 RepID=A0AAV4VP42_CAEEX|nr:hypothetical protein CEXT_104761 [Caerostris extrusa]